jgi:ribosomal protein L28
MKTFGQSLTFTVLTVFLLTFATPSVWSAPTSLMKKTASTSSTAEVDGFRSAKFGMNQDMVLKAIFKDFKITKSKVKVETHPIDRTENYLIQVNDLIPDSGIAQIAYLFGYKTKKLFQVNVLWKNGADVKKSSKSLITTANLLRSLFLKKGFAKDKAIANHQLKDGSIIVFRGKDNLGRMVLLFLNNPVGTPEQAKLRSAKEKAELAKRMRLMLSYMENPAKPDIFKIKKDDF